MKMVEDGASKIERSIEEGLLDVGILLWPVDQAVFDSFPIVRDQLKVVMHPAHRLADRERIELAELELERFIFFLTAISPCMTGSRTHAVRRASFPASYPKAPSGI